MNKSLISFKPQYLALKSLLSIIFILISMKSDCQSTLTSRHQILADKVAVRALPKKNSKRIGVLNNGDEISVVNDNTYLQDAVDGLDGLWMKTNLDGQSGYVFNAYVSTSKIQIGTDSIYFYAVDTSKQSIGLTTFKNANWYSVFGKVLEPSSAPEIVWKDDSNAIHYDNVQNMVATNLYLPNGIDLTRLFSYNKIVVNDTAYISYSYELISQDSLLIKFDGQGNKSKLLDLQSLSEDASLHHNIESLLDLNGDGILDVLFTITSNYEQQYYFLLSQSGTLNFNLCPITFKAFPYEGC